MLILLYHGSNSSGIYQCPVAGTYIFHVTLTNIGNDTSQWHAELVRENEAVMNITAWKSTYTYADNWVGTNLCIIHCGASETVWLRISYSEGSGANLHGAETSEFSGFLLHNDLVSNE